MKIQFSAQAKPLPKPTPRPAPQPAPQPGPKAPGKQKTDTPPKTGLPDHDTEKCKKGKTEPAEGPLPACFA